MKTKTDERMQNDGQMRTTTYFYDAMNRLKTKTYSDGAPEVNYGYSAVAYSRGRLTSVSSGVSSAPNYSATNYTAYDPLGRVTASSQTTYSLGQNRQYVFPSYTYNLADGLKSVQYPSGRVVTTNYDNLNRPSGVIGYASGIGYAAHGASQQMNLGGAGLSETRVYNRRLQTESITSLGQNRQYVFPNYTYNLADGSKSVQYPAGSVQYPSGRVVTTNYDNLNRPNGVIGY